MRAFLIALLFVGSSPAQAASCPYENESGDVLAFLDNGQNTVTIDRAQGRKLLCTWAVTPDGPHEADIQCDDGTKAGYFLAPDALGADNQNLLIFEDRAWYRRCA